MTVVAQKGTVLPLSGKRIRLKRSRYSDILATNSTQLNTGHSEIKRVSSIYPIGYELE